MRHKIMHTFSLTIEQVEVCEVTSTIHITYPTPLHYGLDLSAFLESEKLSRAYKFSIYQKRFKFSTNCQQILRKTDET